MDDEAVRRHIAGEVRAEIARQKRVVGEAAKAAGLKRSAFFLRFHGHRDFRTGELFALARWLGVDAQQFLPSGYAISSSERAS